MKFSAKTYMQTATFRDMSLGRKHNTMADSPLAGFYHNAEYQSYFWTNFWTYFMFSFSLGCCFFACVLVFWAKQGGEYDLEGPVKETLLWVGLFKNTNTDKDKPQFERQRSGSSDNSKEKPLIGDDDDDDRFV
jgi:hypothetical protein